VYTFGSQFSGFAQAHDPENFPILASLPETKAQGFMSEPESAIEMIEYTKRQILYVFSGLAFSCSFYSYRTSLLVMFRLAGGYIPLALASILQISIQVYELLV
jgi:hypothetical protein